MKRIFVGVLIGLFVLVSTVTGAELDKAELSSFIEKEMETWKVPGLAVAVVKDGKVIYSEGFGYKDLKKKDKITPLTIFSLGSSTKAFTATAAGILVDQKKLEWDKPIREYFTSFRLKDSAATQKATIVDLLCHRSGLSRQDFVRDNMPGTRLEIVNRLRYFQPGDDFRNRFQYSNLAFTSAGYIMAQQVDSTWEDLVRNEILDPLEMKHTVFSVTDSQKAPDFAKPHIEGKAGVEEMVFQDNDVLGPAGSMCSNVTDLSNWLLFNLNHGKFKERQVISPRTLGKIHFPHVVVPRPVRYKEVNYDNYGLGWFVTAYHGHRHIHHGGVLFGFTSLVSFLPNDNIGVVVLANLNYTPLTTIVERYVYDKLLGKEPVPWSQRNQERWKQMEAFYERWEKEAEKDRKLDTKPSHPLEAYTGKFHHPGYGTLSIQKDGEHLKVVMSMFTVPLTHYHYDVFKLYNKIKETTRLLHFLTDETGAIDSFQLGLMNPKLDPIKFTRIKEKQSK